MKNDWQKFCKELSRDDILEMYHNQELIFRVDNDDLDNLFADNDFTLEDVPRTCEDGTMWLKHTGFFDTLYFFITTAYGRKGVPIPTFDYKLLPDMGHHLSRERFLSKITDNDNHKYVTTDELDDILKTIKDSGDRTTFDTGAVRDLQGGKGRFDLMPLFNVNELLPTRLYEMDCMYDFVSDGNTDALKKALTNFMDRVYPDRITAIFELSKHFEEGAKKYGENNWQKGIESKYYINSAGHHLLQYERGDIDEPHDRSFMWNMMCCIWTCEEMPQLNTYGSAFVKPVIKN